MTIRMIPKMRSKRPMSTYGIQTEASSRTSLFTKESQP